MRGIVSIENSNIYTVGHSNLDPENFIKLLKDNTIDVVVDVRSNPYSRYASQFNKSNIQKYIQSENIKYLFLGKELGGKPADTQFYDDEGFVLYSKIAETALFNEGIVRLVNGVQNYKIALMCSEESPANCHRMLMIARVLSDHAIKTLHIRGDGSVQTEDDVLKENRKLDINEKQQSLFAVENALEWKSTHPVLKKNG